MYLCVTKHYPPPKLTIPTHIEWYFLRVIMCCCGPNCFLNRLVYYYTFFDLGLRDLSHLWWEMKVALRERGLRIKISLKRNFFLPQCNHTPLITLFWLHAFSHAPPNLLVDFKRLAASVCHYKHSFSHRPERHFFLSVMKRM